VTATTTLAADSALARLDWESDHFGLLAAQLTVPELDDDSLAALLRQARKMGVQLLVWPAQTGREVSAHLLSQFAGALVDRKATFTRSLAPTSAAHVHAGRPAVVPFRGSTPTPALVELALAAGAYSRFRVDPRIPAVRFESMYRQWIERSVAGQLADVVLVAAPEGDEDRAERPLGMITLAESGGVASIGLVAVAAEARGRGVGSALVQAAHEWMRARGAAQARVVTQLANAPACRLYERAGYDLTRVQPYYHFWL
jgi:dTDP-4-amino-4,6-dideoxy-D-galactose acyltransferase